MSGSSTPSSAPERDVQMLSIGAQCSDPYCNMVDFLPFKCQHCEQKYCAEHYLPQAHRCDHYDESKLNRVAPPCPLCNTPVAIPPGEDPNVRMERHFNTDCSVMTGQPTKAKSGPVCARGKCGKVLFAPITCEKCHLQFCPSHRFPNTHNCSAPSASAASPPARQPFANIPQRTTAASAAAMAAIKRSMASTTTSSSASAPTKSSALNSTHLHAPKLAATTLSSSSSSSTQSKSLNPFNPTDRRSDNVLTSALNQSNTHNDTSDATGQTANSTPAGKLLLSSPSPAIDPKSWVPPPVFASA